MVRVDISYEFGFDLRDGVVGSEINFLDVLNRTISKWISHSPTSWVIDRHISDLSEDNTANQSPLSFLRYDVILDADWLKRNLGLSMMRGRASALARIDEPRNLRMLAEIGERVARLLPACFDILRRPNLRDL